MKNCPMCGADAEDDTLRCEECSYNFTNLGPGLGAGSHRRFSPVAEERPAPSSQRPDGVTPMMLGWLCLIFAVVALFVALNSGPSQSDMSSAIGPYASSYSAERVARAIATQWLAQITAGAFFSLFLILWSVGYIVNAISFLPGKEQ